MKIILLKVWKYLPYKLQLILSRRFVPLFQVFTAAVILNSSEEILLVRLTYQRKHPWGLPGGNLERGEEPTRAAVRREIVATPPKRQPVVTDEALWLWGRLCDFERHGYLKAPPNDLLEDMTAPMRADVRRLAPIVAEYLHRFEDAQ